jgi:hypothetical protein
MRQIHLGSGPRTLAAAATQRPARPYECRRAKRMRLSAAISGSLSTANGRTQAQDMSLVETRDGAEID